MRSFSIYQLDKSCADYSAKLFAPSSWLSERPNMKDYIKVYDGELYGNPTNLQACEDIFVEFNINRPDNFKGHSLSVSDVIGFDGEFYYCDDYGFFKL